MYDRLIDSRLGIVLKWLFAAVVLCLVVLNLMMNKAGQPEASFTASAPAAGLLSPIVFPSGEGRVNVNTADSAGLQRLSGIGPAKAQAIIDERQANGPFTYPQDLTEVRGIGLKTVENLLDHICFE